MCAALRVSVPTGLLLKTGLKRREVTIRIKTVITTEGDIWHYFVTKPSWERRNKTNNVCCQKVITEASVSRPSVGDQAGPELPGGV